MTSDETKRITTALRVKVRYPDVDTFVERFAVNVGRSGIFIPTPTPKPVGSEVRFEVRLADDKAVLIGQGVVRWLREPATDRTRATTGMAIELQRVSRASRDVLMKMLQVRKRRGLVDGPGGLPMIEDDHREEGEDGEERASSSRSMRRTTMPPPVGPAPVASETTPPPIAVVPEPAAVAEPVAEPEPVALAEPIAEPVAVPEPEPVAESVPEPVAEPVPEPVAESVPEPEPVADFEPEPVT